MKKSSIDKIIPLQAYKEPGYPGKEFFAAHPGRLLSYVPTTWVNKPLALGTLLAFICSGSITASATDSLPQSTRQKENRVNTGAIEQNTSQREETIAIAPLFIHGSGVGSTGCVVVSPPVFLSEPEALEIILTELKNAGFQFDTNDYIVPGLFTREVSLEYDDDWKPREIERETQYPFYFDFYDSQYNVGIKFISKDNYFMLGGPMATSSVQGYNLIDTAQKTREMLMGQNKTNAAVFYDPMVKVRGYSGVTFKEAQEKGSLELKEQVKNFISWLEREVAAKKNDVQQGDKTTKNME
jgi:hypothetical protein